MGTKRGWVWTERDQVDEDLLCPQCESLNDPDDVECQECGSIIVEAPSDDEFLDSNVEDESRSGDEFLSDYRWRKSVVFQRFLVHLTFAIVGLKYVILASIVAGWALLFGYLGYRFGEIRYPDIWWIKWALSCVLILVASYHMMSMWHPIDEYLDDTNAEYLKKD